MSDTQVKLMGEGYRSLFMHNVRLASPMDEYAKKLSALTKAKPSSKRTDEDRLEIARVEWEGGFYFNDDPEEGLIGPYIPASWVFKNLLEGARRGKRGKKIEDGLAVVDAINPLLYKGPRDLDTMWGDQGQSPFVDFRTVRVGMAKVDRCRPIFPRGWKFEALLEIDSTVLDFDEFRDIAGIAGRLGLGDYRQQYGRYTATVEKV